MEKILDLARSLKCTEIINVRKELTEKSTNRTFKYLLVIDFEATCWNRNDPDRGYSEIIEFPCILYSVEGNKIISYFQQYVMPIENTKLSKFCTELTGISQQTVDNGVPLKTCMMLFLKWLEHIKNKYNVSIGKFVPNNCIFATWSDWDIRNCLKNECRRKQIVLPEIFTKWIDIRALYTKHYMRRPKGLLGALGELGLEFEGRQHCGLDDAKNTAKLVGRMVSEGVILKCTSCL
ncbi:ERI1 exoribonuclease 2 [Diorhabda sublineata]|uniref:ERI1 exoribonuclease 2 n=1 Tax=Diorhabda sublineata TaxID=1163346 RepID=UPI0024E0FB2F|nr:ERI1 exoribonuclease 2 [Diorhabda sublineata]